MEGLLSVAVYVVIIALVIISRKKKINKINANTSGAMPHKHEKNHYTSMADASKLPKGYILLNGEPVRVADLEGK